MEDTPTIAAVRRFLTLIFEGVSPTDAALARALDVLALAYHDAPDGDPSDRDDEPPQDDHQHRCARLRQRFPNYAYYPVVEPLNVVAREVTLGDPIDDLADIAGDLAEVMWRFEHLGPDDAHWHFRFHYQIHWGRHLRELSCYLYAKISHDLAENG